jgi:hypothetical protein
MSYRRVATADASAARGSEAPTNNNDDAFYGGTRRSRSERISDKFQALSWVVVAYFTASYTRFFPTIFTDDRIIRSVFNISIALFCINIILTIYLTIYLPCKFPKTPNLKVSASSIEFWGVYCPRVIPIMTACGIVGSLLLVRACFPIWGFITPLILAVIAMGMFFSLHFVPWY